MFFISLYHHRVKLTLTSIYEVYELSRAQATLFYEVTRGFWATLSSISTISTPPQSDSVGGKYFSNSKFTHLQRKLSPSRTSFLSSYLWRHRAVRFANSSFISNWTPRSPPPPLRYPLKKWRFGLSPLGYGSCRNAVVQHGGPAPSVDIKRSL